MNRIDTAHLRDPERQSAVDNIFAIDGADTYLCNIWRYAAGLSQLAVAAWHCGNIEYCLCFSTVFYYAGEVNWTSANFRVAPRSDCKRLLTTLRPWEADELELYLKDFLLFTVALPVSQINIVAAEIYLSTEIPIGFAGF